MSSNGLQTDFDADRTYLSNRRSNTDLHTQGDRHNEREPCEGIPEVQDQHTQFDSHWANESPKSDTQTKNDSMTQTNVGLETSKHPTENYRKKEITYLQLFCEYVLGFWKKHAENIPFWGWIWVRVPLPA